MWTDQEEVIIGTKVFVGNLSYDTTRSELDTLFSEIGELVEVFLPTDRETGRPRGFAFVEYTDPASIPAAVERFDGYELGGRAIRVNEAEDRPQRRPSNFSSDRDRPFAGPRGGGAKPKGSRRNLRRGKRSL